jgi:hypothetical protein
VGEVDDGGRRRAGGFGCPGVGSRRKGRGLRPARGASGEADEVGGCEEGRPEDVAT